MAPSGSNAPAALNGNSTTAHHSRPGQIAMADIGSIANLSSDGRQQDRVTQEAQSQGAITSEQERQIRQALDRHNRSRSRSLSRSRSHDSRPDSENETEERNRAPRRLSVKFDDHVDINEFSVSSDEGSPVSVEHPAVPPHIAPDLQQPSLLDEFFSHFWAAYSFSCLWVYFIFDKTRQIAVSFNQSIQPTLYVGFQIVHRVWSIVPGVKVVISKMLTLAVITACCLVVASLWSFLAGSMSVLLSILELVWWLVLVVGQMAQGLATLGRRGDPTLHTAPILPRATSTASSNMTAGTVLPIRTLPVIAGPQLRGQDQPDMIDSSSDLDQDWVGASIVHNVLAQISGGLNLCAGNDSDEMPIVIKGLCDVRASRRESARQISNLRSRMGHVLSGSFKQVQVLQRQIIAYRTSESLFMAGGRNEGTGSAATTFGTKSNKALSSSWVPGCVEVALKEKAALNWMQAIQASLRKVDQRASTMLHALTTINSTCASTMVKDLQQAVENGTKRQEDMSLAILLQQVALGITGHGSQTATASRKTQSINPSMMKVLSNSIDPLEVALSYETTHLAEWLRDIARVATQALKLKVKVVQIKDEAMQMANQMKDQQINLEKRHAQRNGLWVINVAEFLLFGWLSPDNFNDLDSLQAIYVDTHEDFQQEWFQTLLANLDRWDELLFAVARDSQGVIWSLAA